jgi:hypothetical protein
MRSLKSFSDFIFETSDTFIIQEGGNVVIDDIEAERIDLKRFTRSEIVPVIDRTLDAINKKFEKEMGMPIWNENLFKSKLFLSGSAYHFFMTDSIKDDDFVAVKSTVGDIDTQCSASMSEIIKDFLDKNAGSKIGDAKFIGYKSSAGQYITLWKFEKYDLPVQIDMELVVFDEKGFPTAWSQFSHSSAWADLSKGMKGAAHKFLLQSLDSTKFFDVIIKAKTARGKDKVLNRGTHSFSVSHGIREKMVPVTGPDGEILYYDNLPQYKELSTSDSAGNTDLEYIFNHFFGISPSKKELEMMGSFVGTIELVKKHFKKPDWVKVADTFVNKLWGAGAQSLYRGNPQLDLDEKSKMVNYLCDALGIDPRTYTEISEKYYVNYK